MSDPQQQQQQQQQAPQDYSETVPFNAVCELFEHWVRETRPGAKRELMQRFFAHYHGDDFYPLVRLLLPQHDKARGVYNLKESSLARMLIDALGISERAEDGYRLLHWRRPQAAAAAEAGDFGNAVFLTLASRCPAERPTLSVAAVNRALDELCAAPDARARGRVLRALLRVATAREMKWIVRLVLKELRTGMSEKSVLGHFHPQAVELYNRCSDLRRVFQELRARPADFRLDLAEDSGIALFHPVKPMLASRHPPEDLLRVMHGEPFVIETKFDGERVQIHKDGERFELFSRNCNSVTTLYGSFLETFIRERILVDKCIIDGELMVFDELLNRFEDFGKIKTFVINAKGPVAGTAIAAAQPRAFGDRSNYGKRLCYVAFDVLFVSGKSVMQLTLEQRTNILQRIISPLEHSFELVKQSVARTTLEVTEALDAAILNRLEGIMIKSPQSPYIPNDRSNRWVKIKPEYLDGVGDDLDLLVLGGYYGRGGRGGVFSHFVVGVPSGDITSDGRPVFVSLAKVGTGYSDVELERLHADLQPWVRPYKQGCLPPYVRLVEVGQKEDPDVWVEPEHSKVLQIKSAQIVPSDKYKAMITLRFPRVVRIRNDKGWKDTTTLQEVVQMRDTFAGRYAKRQLSSLGGEAAAASGGQPRKRHKKPGEGLDGVPLERIGPVSTTVSELYREADASRVRVVTSALEGKEICVVNGTAEHPKDELERLVVQHGGTRVQNPTAETFCAVAGRESLKAKNIISMRVCDVASVDWLLQIAKEGKLVPLHPKHLLFATGATVARLMRDFDPFGDSFFEDATPDSLREVFREIDRQIRKAQPLLPPAAEYDGTVPLPPAPASGNPFDEQGIDISSLEMHYFQHGRPWWGILRGVIVYLDMYRVPGDPETRICPSPLSPLAAIVKFFGGSVTDTIAPETTHVVVNESPDGPRLRALRRVIARAVDEPPHVPKHIVKSSWLMESIKCVEILHEANFSV